jgi:hypothetical protein
MKSIFRTQLDWNRFSPASARVHAGRHAIPGIVDAGGNAVPAVGLYAGAAAGQGSEEDDGAEGGK